MRRSLVPLVLALLCHALALPARAQSDLVQPTDLFRLQVLGDVALSPTGRYVAYTVRTVVADPDDEGGHAVRTHLWLARTDGSRPPRPLTRGDRSASSPAWHPDGERLAFVRTGDGKPQVHVLPLAGGEPYPVTELEHGATEPVWAPDGRALLVASTLPHHAVDSLLNAPPPWPDERPGRQAGDVPARAEPAPDGRLAEVRAFLRKNRRDGIAEVTHRLDFQGEQALAPEPEYRHLYLVETDGATDAVPEARALTTGYASTSGGAWLPDSRHVIYAAPADQTRHPDRVRDAALFLARTDGTVQTTLVDLDGWRLTAPRVAPDGDRIAFLGTRTDDLGYAQPELGLYHLSTRETEWLTEAFDRSVGPPAWSENGWWLYFVAPSEGGFPLYRLRTVAPPPPPDTTAAALADSFATDSLAAFVFEVLDDTPDPRRLARVGFGPPELDLAEADSLTADSLAADPLAVEPWRVPEPLTGTGSGVRSFAVGPGVLAYVLTEPENPYELYAARLSAVEPERLTRHNADWLAGKRLSRPQAHTLTRDSLEIDYWTLPPTTLRPGQRYPLLLQIHGGPSAMWGPGEATMWHEFQTLAARGYGIVFANPRGSGGYGEAFQRANYRDWGAGPSGDVLAALDAAIADEPWVDPDRLVVTGGSYAGYLTAWIVGHTDRFRAAVAQRGVYDLPTFLGEGNAFRLVESHFGGFPWQPEADSVLAAESPLTYVEQIRTPLLILHASEDLRTGVSQSEMLYRSLKLLDRPVEYVRYPAAGHDLSRTGDPDQRLDRLLRIYEFFERYAR